jgi:serine protease AprX
MTMAGSGFAPAARPTLRTIRRGWQWGAVALATSLASVVGPATAASAAATPTGAPTGVVVRAADGHLDDAEGVVRAAGGTVERELRIINGFSADVPADAIATIAASPSVLAVTEDTQIKPMSLDSTLDVQSTVDSTLSAASDLTNPLGFDALADFGSLSSVTRLVGAQALWQRGYTGKGVDVALIDTGVAPVSGIVDNVVDGPDLSFDYQAGAPAGIDAFGHGTHMAGIIAGRDADATESSEGCTTCLNDSGYSDTTKFVGVAPDARVVNVKVGSFDGATDVSQVIAGIDWVVQHRNDNGLNIRVLNLSFGTDSKQGYRADPLSYAAEVAWRHGIVVVAAAGNDGTDVRLTDPAYNPTILAVGASDPDNNRDPREGFVADFSNGGTARKVDVVAPGMHIASLRSPGSFIDELVPTSRLADRFTRGTGTSQAAAVTSGFVADLIQRYPQATPNQIKALVLGSAQGLRHDGERDGNGIISGKQALDDRLPTAWEADQDFAEAFGLGSLEATRGTGHVEIAGEVLSGEQDVFGSEWDGRRWSQAAWDGTSWNGGVWNGRRWSGDNWDGQRWSNANWEGTDWAGRRWSGARWSAARWSGARWSGARWTGVRWSESDWSGRRWSDGDWSDGDWSGIRWSGIRWSGIRWSGDWS